MKIGKIVAIVVLVYVGIVVAFESLIGYFQPQDTNTMVITTQDGSGSPKERVVARLDVDDPAFCASNRQADAPRFPLGK